MLNKWALNQIDKWLVEVYDHFEVSNPYFKQEIGAVLVLDSKKVDFSHSNVVEIIENGASSEEYTNTLMEIDYLCVAPVSEKKKAVKILNKLTDSRKAQNAPTASFVATHLVSATIRASMYEKIKVPKTVLELVSSHSVLLDAKRRIQEAISSLPKLKKAEVSGKKPRVIQEGTRARNPKTGEVVVLVDGEWIPEQPA